MSKMEIGLICKNKLNGPLEGKMKLPEAFVLEYGCSLPQKIFIELPSGEVWFGKYVRNSHYIDGLDDFISFYGIKPYYLVAMRYYGGPYFKFNIFNECCVEIFYPLSCKSSFKLRSQRKPSFSILSSSTGVSEIEIDKMASTCRFNALHTLFGFHEIIIHKRHLAESSEYEVMSSLEFKNLCMDDAMKSMEFGFKNFAWIIEIHRRNGLVYFNHGWYNFVKEAKISEGDICVIQKTNEPSTFEVAVLPYKLLRQWRGTPDNRVIHQQFSWYKRLKGSALDCGTLEIPRLFAMRMGRELGRNIIFVGADGRKFRGELCVSRKKNSGLKEMIAAYHIYENCVIIFYYVGQSTFNVSVYDSLNCDHLRDISGQFIGDVLRKIEMEETGNGTESFSGTAAVGGHLAYPDEDEEDDVVVIEQPSHMFEGGGNETDEEQRNVERDFPVVLNNVFMVELKKSHFQEKCRGVYCSTSCYELYQNWNTGTIVILEFEGQRFELGVLRYNRSCRFGKGWDDFVRKIGVQKGEKLEFRFLNEYTLAVSKFI